MNEFEKLEAELRELRPLSPSEEFISRLENALGDAGKVAMRCLPDEDSLEHKKSASTTSEQPSKLLSFPRMAVFTGATGMGLAALWAILLHFSSALVPEIPVESNHSEPPLLVQSTDIESPSSISDDPDSPLHGLSLDQIQDISVMPVSGWLDPQINERLLRMVDEGIFQQPGGLPTRRVRHYFMDETLWSHPASDTRILSTTPREEVILIELETY